MTDLTSLLATSAAEGARLLALDWLERVRSTRTALADAPTDPEALHALRVALTRLRATLRLFDPVLDGGLGRRGRRALRNANAALGPVRDRDVQDRQLEQLTAALDAEAQLGAQWLRDRFAAQRPHRLHRALRTVAAQLDPAFEGWQHRLRHYVQPRVAGVPLNDTPLAVFLVHALHGAIERLQADADAAHGTTDAALVHSMRISVKRLRALLVPWLPDLAEAGPLFEQATELQDTIGSARDAHLLARRARRESRRAPEHGDALRALAEQLEERAVAAHHKVHARWLSSEQQNALADLLAAVPAAADAFARHGRPDEEIERKYLLHALPDEVRALKGIRIAQGWLPGERLRERLRRSVYPDGRVQWTRTVKVGTGVARVEVEEDTPAVLFETLWPLTVEARVKKVRYEVADGAFVWQLDVFLDRELLLAEIELPSADTPVSFPAWLAPCVTREVTGDPAYVNANLARARRPPASA
jgi:CHAD domain-containing protein/CYTH domain-containing protein